MHKNTVISKNAQENKIKAARLQSIKKGELNWLGKGFLDVIKKDCECSKGKTNATDESPK